MWLDVSQILASGQCCGFYFSASIYEAMFPWSDLTQGLIGKSLFFHTPIVHLVLVSVWAESASKSCHMGCNLGLSEMPLCLQGNMNLWFAINLWH